MRLVNFGPQGREELGVLTDDEHVLPLRSILERAGVRTTDLNELLALWPAIVPIIERGGAVEEPVKLADIRLGPPLPRPGKIVAIGFNYAHHGDGVLTRQPSPGGEPVIFLKPPTTVSGPKDPILKPVETSQLDYEAELAVVIGRSGRRITRESAHRHIAGYVLANDVTARDIALGQGPEHPLLLQIARGKGYPTFCPLGPWLLTADEPDADAAREISLSVNGIERQRGSTADMLVDVPGLIASISASMDLHPGDLILTGTPPGCGFQQDPPAYLSAGDHVRAAITGLGEMDLLVRDEVVPDALHAVDCQPILKEES